MAKQERNPVVITLCLEAVKRLPKAQIALARCQVVQLNLGKDLTHYDIEGRPIKVVFNVYHLIPIQGLLSQFLDKKINVSLNDTLLGFQSFEAETRHKRFSHSWMVFFGTIYEGVDPIWSRLRPYWILRHLSMTMFAVAVYVLPSLSIDERQLIRGKPHDWAVYVMKFLGIVH